MLQESLGGTTRIPVRSPKLVREVWRVIQVPRAALKKNHVGVTEALPHARTTIEFKVRVWVRSTNIDPDRVAVGQWTNTVPASPHPPAGQFDPMASDERTNPEIDIINVVDDFFDEFVGKFLHHHCIP